MYQHGTRNNVLQQLQRNTVSSLRGVNLSAPSRIPIRTLGVQHSNNNQREIIRDEARGNSSASNDLIGGRAPSTLLINNIRGSEIYNNNTLLMDINPSDYGIFTGLTPSMSFIPSKFVRKVRKVFITFMQNYLDDSTENHWKKVLLLPLILFDNFSPTNKALREKTIANRLLSLENDDWSSFKLASLSKKTVRIDDYTSDQVIAAVSRLAKAGEIGKAFRRLQADTRKIVPTEATLEKLQSKFPQPGISSLSQQQVRAISQYKPENDPDFVPLSATELHVETALYKTKGATAHGFDHMRFEHVKQLWSSSSNDANIPEFRKGLTAIVNIILQGKVPDTFVSMFQDIELCALPKADDDVRPVGLQQVYRKLASSVALQQTREFNETHFEDLQYCMKKSGAEKIVHSFKASIEMCPTWDIFCMDGDNGFGRMNRISALHQVKTKFIALLPLLRSMYGTTSKAWYMGLPTGIESIDCEEGCQQGDVLSMWFYAMGIHPFIQGIRDILGHEGFTKWFADDGNSTAPFDKMVEVIEYVIQEGPKVGYFMKRNKGTYLLGKCTSYNEAMSRKEKLINLGLNGDMIILHPDNEPDTAHLYGCKMVGTWIGNAEYIQANLRVKITALRKEAELIKGFPDPQVQSLMLRWCFSQKIGYLQRTTSPHLLDAFTTEFDVLKREILASIIQCPVEVIDESLWEQCCLNIQEGGLGLQYTKSVSYAAYIASMVECSDTIKFNFPTIMESNNPIIQALQSSLLQSSNIQGRETPLTLNDVEKIAQDIKGKAASLQSTISDMQSSNMKRRLLDSIIDTKRIAWIISLTDPTSGTWLEVCPKMKHQEFSPPEFRASLRRRLLLPQQSFVPGSKCNCKNRPFLDPLGHHISTGCSKDSALLNTHDTLCYCMKDFLNFAGIMTRREETGAFKEAFPDNNQRPDLSVFNYPSCPKPKLILDISLAHPVGILTEAVLSRNQAMLPGRAGTKRFLDKQRKYVAIANANNLEFLPIIFETTGQMHEATRKFFEVTLQLMSDHPGLNKRMKAITSRYWAARISCCIQKSIANTILSRSRSINGNLTRERGLEYAMDFIRTFGMA